MGRGALVYAGLDIGSTSCHVVAMDRHGSTLLDRKFSTSEANLISTFESIEGSVQVHLEATDLAGWVRRVVKPRVARVVVSHARTNAWIAKDPLKKDQIDAFKLAELLRMGRVHEVYYADEDHRERFKHLVQHYDDVTREEVRLKLKIKGRLRAQGLFPRGSTVFSEDGRQDWLVQIKELAEREILEQLYGMLDQALKTQGDALKTLRRESGRYPEVELLHSVPGVGLLGACRFIAYVQTPHRFSSKRKLWRYCKLGVTDRSSDGKPLGWRSLDRNGCGRLKDMSRKAFMGAMQTKADNSIKRAFHRSLRSTHDATHARLSTQRKIVAVLRAIWLKGEKYDDHRDEKTG